jgi:hypothetical protein
MAGSASNWFKPNAGPLKGQAVYLSKAQQGQVVQAIMNAVGGKAAPPDPRGMVSRLLDRGTTMASPSVKLAWNLANSERPAGVAQAAPKTAPAPVSAPAQAALAPDKAMARFLTAIADSYSGKQRLAGYDDDWSGDHDLYAMTQIQGFHGAPKAVTRAEMDALISGGSEELWRGVQTATGDGGGERSGLELAQMFLSGGGYYAGYGIYGGGTYFASTQDSDSPRAGKLVAKDYARGAGGALVRATLAPGANIADFDKLKRQAHAWQITQIDQADAELKAGRITMRERSARYGNAQRIVDELSSFAAMMGYDAVRVARGRDTGGISNGRAEPAQVIILNRSVVIVEDSARPAAGEPA